MAGIELVVPRAVESAAAKDDPVDARLLPGEATLVAQAVDTRRREFTTGRHCARIALDRLGAPPAAIGAGPNGEPLWPRGVVGSITHCAGYRAAAVAWASDVRSIGIDAEPHAPLPADVLDAIALTIERAQLRRLTLSRGAVSWDRVLFSAKEAVYKAWFPLTGRTLDFADARVALAADGTFAAQVLVPGPIAKLSGRWAVTEGLVVTAVVVRPPGWATLGGSGPPG